MATAKFDVAYKMIEFLIPTPSMDVYRVSMDQQVFKNIHIIMKCALITRNFLDIFSRSHNGLLFRSILKCPID